MVLIETNIFDMYIYIYLNIENTAYTLGKFAILVSTNKHGSIVPTNVGALTTRM